MRSNMDWHEKMFRIYLHCSKMHVTYKLPFSHIFGICMIWFSIFQFIYTIIHFNSLRIYNKLVIILTGELSWPFMYLNLFTSLCLNLLWQTNITFPLIIYFFTLGNKLSKTVLFLLYHTYSGDTGLPHNSHIFQSGDDSEMNWL